MTMSWAPWTRRFMVALVWEGGCHSLSERLEVTQLSYLAATGTRCGAVSLRTLPACQVHGGVRWQRPSGAATSACRPVNRVAACQRICRAHSRIDPTRSCRASLRDNPASAILVRKRSWRWWFRSSSLRVTSR
jgi:hypothetical protein